MASHTVPILTAGQKLYTASQLGLAFISAIAQLTASMFHTRKVEPWQKRLLGYFLKSPRVRRLPKAYTRGLMLAPTGITISRFCASKNVSHDTVTISADAKYPDATLHFVDCTAATIESGPLLLYLHGGGYANPINAAHLPFALECANTAKVGLVVLEYTLTPEAPYPTQLVQAVAAVRYLLVKRQPGDISFGGDSAGANLVLGLLAHCMEPSPYAPAIELAEVASFRAALLLSPWVDTTYSTGTYVSNESTDYLGREAMLKCNDMWQPEGDEVWASPMKRGHDFWSTVPVKRVLVTTGEYEVFYDDNLQMAKQLGAGDPQGKVKLFEFAADFHVGFVVGTVVGVKDFVHTKRILDWLQEG